MKKELEDKIFECFRDLFQSFDFTIVRRGKIIEEFEFSNSKCTLLFGYDMGYVTISFINPSEKIPAAMNTIGNIPSFSNYSLVSVFKFLFPNANLELLSNNNSDIAQQLCLQKDILEKYFSNVLNGDFSWVKLYRERETKIAQKVEYIFKNWDDSHPVRRMFQRLDPRWEEEFDKYVLK